MGVQFPGKKRYVTLEWPLMQPRLNSKRNRRRLERNETDNGVTLRFKLSKSLPNVAYCLFVARVKLYSRNKIYSKYHNHASAYEPVSGIGVF